MSERDEARLWLEKEFSDEKIATYWYDEPRYLARCLENGKLNYAYFFRRGSWTDENVDLYAEYLKANGIKEKHMLSIDSFKLFTVFVDKRMLDNALRVTMSPSYWTDECAVAFSEKIPTGDLSLEILKNASFLYTRNPIILKGVLDAGRFDLLDAFDINHEAWSNDNLNLFVSKLTDAFNTKEEISIPEKYLKRKEIYIGLIKNGIYDYAGLFDSTLAGEVLKDQDAFKVMSDCIVDIYNAGQTSDHMVWRLFEEPDIYLKLIDNGIYDYVYLYHPMGNKRVGLYDSPDKVRILLNAFNKIEESDVKKALYGHDVFDRSNEFLKMVLNNDDVGVVQGYLWRVNDAAWEDDDVKKYVDKFINDFRLPSGVRKSKYGLSLVLDLDDYSKYIHFDSSAWDKENIYKCCDNALRNEKNSFYINIEDPYYLYLAGCFFPVQKKELKPIYVSNYRVDSSSLKNPDLLYSLSKMVSEGKANYDKGTEQFLRIIYDTNSSNVINLMRYLIDDNFENIGLLFDENGMTDYLFEHLIFDSDYRNYCESKGINYFDRCNNRVHLQYLSFVSRYPEIVQKIIISPENVNEYFDDKGIKQELLEKLFRPNCVDLLIKLDSEIEYPKLSEKKQFVVNKMKVIDNDKIRQVFFKYVSSRYNELDESKIDDVYKIVRRIEYSNSSEIRAFGDLFAGLILERENPEKELIEIEKIFIQDNIPFVGKIYQVFKKLYPNYKGIGTTDKMSPTLKNMTYEERDRVIFNDLLRVELGSNNRNLQSYLVSFFNANMLYEFVRDGKRDINDLSEDEKRKLSVYFERVSYLTNNILNMNFEINDDISIFDKLSIIERKLREVDNRFTNIPDYLVKNICVGSGFNNLMDMIAYSVYKPQAMDELHRKSLGTKFKLEKGDYVKGIRSLTYLPNILQNGSVAAEFLGDSSNSDLTPLDTDLSLITSDGSIDDALSSTVAKSYGPIYLVIRGNNSDRFDITRNDEMEVSQQDKSKIELFKTGALGTGHYGIRTGFASSEIDYIIASSDFEKIGFEIALNGIYIPVVDKGGNVRFSADDYDRLRAKMNGLSYYGSYQYHLSENLGDDEILKISSELSDSSINAVTKRNAIYSAVSDVLGKFGIRLKTELDNNLTHGTMEFFDTGSTGRGTNVADDSDFDFIVRVDRDLLFDDYKMQNIRKTLLEKFDKDSTGDFRLKDVYLEDIDDPLKIDMTFVVKSNKLDYATESCIKDRLDTIKTLHPEQYNLVVANIVFAKKFFKEAGCYKPKHAGDNPQGGLGGVGTETWILQHGGSFYDAAVDFLEYATLYPKLEDFQRNYSIQDFGKNHLAEKRGHYPYDNFVYNLNADGFEKMKKALGQYVSSKNKESSSGAVHR